ncbi:MAG: HAD family hydrolase [Coriobacteriales bacterium]|nr:HAD family hydrolase [Coriobacteriales bacterium]
MIKLVLTDLDDTLIKNGLPSATDRALAGIHAMLDAGLRFGPVSGRIPSDLGWMFNDDAACYATGAPVNGQMIYIDGELVHVEKLDGAELNRIAHIASHIPDACLALYDFDAPSDEGAGYFVSPSEEHAQACMRIFTHFKRSVRELDQPHYVKANLWCAGDRAHITEVRDMLREEFPSMDFVFPSPTAPIIDISPAGWSKGTAVHYIARELGLSLDEVAVFGDSENDLSMICAVPNSVAVSNASPEVAKAARWHIGSSADDAVADALFQIAEAAQTGDMPAFMRD